MRRQEFFGAASDCRSALDLDLDISVDLGGAGGIGDTTGMAAGHSSTITSSLRTAESLAMTDSITVISITATLAMADSITATLATGALTMATHFTEARAFMRSQEGTRAGSVVLVTAEMLAAFLRAGTPALEAVASMAVVPMAVVPMVVAGGTNDRCIGPH
jgi:hypothetical protein